MTDKRTGPDESLVRLKRWLDLDDDGEAALTFVPDEEHDADAAALAVTMRAIADEAASQMARRVEASPIKMAARSLTSTAAQSSIELTIDGIVVRFSEDAQAVIHIAGAVPDEVTHLALGTDSFTVERRAEDDMAVPDLMPSTFEDFLELHHVSPSRFPITWVRR